MKRRHILLAGAALEIFRYTILLMKLPELFGDSLGVFGPPALRLLAAPNLLFPIMLFLLWWNEGKYYQFKALSLAGKAVSFFAALLLLPRLLGMGTNAKISSLSLLLAIFACMLVDIVTVIIMITMQEPEETIGALREEKNGSLIETVTEN